MAAGQVNRSTGQISIKNVDPSAAAKTLKDGKPVARFAFDGKAAILVDEAAKSYEATDAQWFQ